MTEKSKPHSNKHFSILDYTIGSSIHLLLGRTIGKGTFGKVKLAIHNATEQKVTLNSER